VTSAQREAPAPIPDGDPPLGVGRARDARDHGRQPGPHPQPGSQTAQPCAGPGSAGPASGTKPASLLARNRPRRDCSRDLARHGPGCARSIRTVSPNSIPSHIPTHHFSLSSPNSRPKIKISLANLPPFHVNSLPKDHISTRSNHPSATRVSAPTLKFLQPCHEFELLCYNRSWRIRLRCRKRTLPEPYHPCHDVQPNTCREACPEHSEGATEAIQSQSPTLCPLSFSDLSVLSASVVHPQPPR
jgi:hypothetical protein